MTPEQTPFKLGSATDVLRREYWVWLPFACLSFVAASLVLTGWPEGLIPNLKVPYAYDGNDFMFHLWMAQRVIEGWLFDNVRSGFPFGSNFLDYPGSDAASHLVIKLFGLLTGSAQGALNLFYLAGFPAIFISTYAVSRALGLRRAFAVCTGILFAFQAFHVLRLPHVFFTTYFVAPIYFYAGFRIYFAESAGELMRPRTIICAGVVFAILASFGIYYAIFGITILLVAGFAAWVRHGDRCRVIPALGAALAIATGVVANVAPNVVYRLQAGPNPGAVIRDVAESETYGLKLIQLLLPRPGHRSEGLREITRAYGVSHPLVNENVMSSLGAVGSLGLLVLGISLFRRLAGGSVDERLTLLALLALVLFLLGTIGGFGSIFATFVTPLIRAWNRVSIFLAFTALLGFFLVLETVVRRCANRAIVACAVAAAIGVLGFLDQTAPSCRDCNAHTRAAFEQDRDFVRQIERSLPANAAVYQLPYIPFPEYPPLHNLINYQLLMGFVHSKTLRWSFGGMKGREGDRFFKALAEKPVEEQIEVVRQKGFAGIYVDRRGYQDGGKVLVERLASLLGAPAVSRADGAVVFFPLQRR